MNIIGGIYRGRKIVMPKGIRPTSNKVREALFNILGKGVLDAAVLDLFAGSGSLGLEALSRGAASVVFCDNNIKCIRIIINNMKALGISEGAKVMQLGARQAITKLSGRTRFDLVFLDRLNSFKLMKSFFSKCSYGFHKNTHITLTFCKERLDLCFLYIAHTDKLIIALVL